MTETVAPEELPWRLATGWTLIDEDYLTEDGNYVVKKKKLPPITSEIVLARLTWPRRPWMAEEAADN